MRLLIAKFAPRLFVRRGAGFFWGGGWGYGLPSVGYADSSPQRGEPFRLRAGRGGAELVRGFI